MLTEEEEEEEEEEETRSGNRSGHSRMIFAGGSDPKLTLTSMNGIEGLKLMYLFNELHSHAM